MATKEYTSTAEAVIASEMIIKWGMTAATPDGEDSAGRQSARLLTPEELVDRACSTAYLAIDAFKRRGWLIDKAQQEKGE